jgi:diadenosine tetraphosphate (Ap4A) HIT family hydrolase
MGENMFSLHPQLEKDCTLVGNLSLCSVLLVNDANYPWLILVPRREGIREAFELTDDDQLQLMRESNQLAALMAAHFEADKMNVAALGNQVPQLHVHHIARYLHDAAWPGPVWGVKPATDYDASDKAQRLAELRQALPQLK